MKYQKVKVGDDVIPGDKISDVHPPTSKSLTWRIILKNGNVVEATGNVSVWINNFEEEGRS